MRLGVDAVAEGLRKEGGCKRAGWRGVWMVVEVEVEEEKAMVGS